MQEFLQPVNVWAHSADGHTLFEALGLAYSLKAEHVQRALCELGRDRLVAAEKQNAILKGGKHLGLGSITPHMKAMC